MNRAETDTPPATVEYTINALVGGIRSPVGADAIFTQVANAGSYPSSSSIGAMMPPIAEAAATAEPDSAPKNMLASTLVCAREPGIRPDSSWANRISLLAMPPLFMILPASMNKGTARREKLSTPLFIFCMTMKLVWSQGRFTRVVAMEEIAILMEIGQPRISNTAKTPNNTRAVIAIFILIYPPP